MQNPHCVTNYFVRINQFRLCLFLHFRSLVWFPRLELPKCINLNGPGLGVYCRVGICGERGGTGWQWYLVGNCGPKSDTGLNSETSTLFSSLSNIALFSGILNSVLYAPVCEEVTHTAWRSATTSGDYIAHSQSWYKSEWKIRIAVQQSRMWDQRLCSLKDVMCWRRFCRRGNAAVALNLIWF